MTAPLTQMLSTRRPLILDGAMGTELQRRGVDTTLPLWSARALIDEPEAVLQIHLDYIAAGADIITTNTFRTTRRTFRRAGLPDRSSELTARAVEIARQATRTAGPHTLLVAGSIAPLEDCYRPDLVPPEADLHEEHGELARRLDEAGVDILLLETMNTIREAVAACRQAVATGRETVVSFLCNNEGNLYSGELLEEAVRTIEPLGPAAFSLNCISPRFLPLAISRLRAATGKPFAVYANVGLPGGEQGWHFTRETGEVEYAAHAARWVKEGAAIVGGCCGTTPAYISFLRIGLGVSRSSSSNLAGAPPA